MTSLVALPYADLHAHDRATSAWGFNAAGVLTEAAANLPRIDYDPTTLGVRGLLTEAQAINWLPNPAAVGAVVAGALPTGWSGVAGGLTAAVSWIGAAPDGRPGVEYTVTGTSNGVLQNILCATGNPPSVPAAPSVGVWTGQIGMQVLQADGCAISMLMTSLNSTGATINVNQHVGATISVGAPYAVQELANRILTNASTAGASIGVRVGSVTNGVPVTARIRIFSPQLWATPIAPSPSFPPTGSTGASDRAADRITRTLNHRFARSGFTILARGLFAQAAPAGMTRGVLQLDDGTNANRIRVENLAGGSALQLVTTIAGADVATLPLGSMTPGTPFSVAFAAQDGDLAAVLGGGALQSASVAVPPGLAFMRVGATGFDHANPMNGWYRAHRLLRGRLDNAALLTLAA